MKSTPVATAGNPNPQLLANVASVTHRLGPTNITHYNIAVTFDVLANVQGTDLGRVASAIYKLLDEVRPTLPRGTTVVVRGQVQTMNTSFEGLGFGLIFAVAAGLPADGRQFSIVDRSADHSDGVARRAVRHRVDAVCHRHDRERAVADGGDHVHRRGDGQLDPADHVCQRPAQRSAKTRTTPPGPPA